MSESMELWGNEHIETGAQQGEQREWISQADISRVEQAWKKAKQMAWFIAKKKQQNTKIANFLTFLLKQINNDKMYLYIYELFFIQYGNWSRNSKIKNDINSLVLIGMFIPFYLNEAKKYWVLAPFEKIENLPTKLPIISEYIQYLKNLSDTFHDNTDMNKTKLLYLILEIINEFWLINRRSLSKEEYHDFVKQVSLDLFWKAPSLG